MSKIEFKVWEKSDTVYFSRFVYGKVFAKKKTRGSLSLHRVHDPRAVDLVDLLVRGGGIILPCMRLWGS